MFRAAVLLLGSLLQRSLITTEGHRGTNSHVFYAVKLDGGIKGARALTEQHGLEFIQRVGSLEGVFTLRDGRARPDRATFESRLATSAGVHWVQRQYFYHRDKRVPPPVLDHSSQRRESATDRQPEENTSDQSLTFNDPLWPMQWELFSQGQYNGLDLNVMPVWSNNITGRGVVVTIIDDGVDHTNKDLQKNFEALASCDLRASHGLSHDPMPFKVESSSHGTRCAGEVAMEANNSYCGVGIAFNARIGGIRLLDGRVTDAMEAAALTFNIHFIDIYVCSWGPRDDGAAMDGPHRLTAQALRLGTHKGRGGKGSIFVWASGNGGAAHDHCGADGYVNSIFNIAIGAVTQTGKPTYFGEPCPGVMAVTPTGTSVGGPLPLITVTNMGDGCVTHFPGTSSAAPIAAGILALVLEVNPELTWRDVQHLIAQTAKIPNPDQPGWNINAAGYHVHHWYGFGVLDAGLMVQHASQFESLAPQRKCTEEVTLHPARMLASGGVVTVSIQSEACRGSINEINTLEHVQVRLSMSAVCRGGLSISLESPGGTTSRLLDARPNDDSTAGLRNWTLMTVHSWGERPRGVWTLKVTDHKGSVLFCSRPDEGEAAGALNGVTLILYGTRRPRRSAHDGPLRSVVSMGSRHPLPRGMLYQRDRFPPQDLIQWVYRMETDGKVRAADIAAPARRKGVDDVRGSRSGPDAMEDPQRSQLEGRTLPERRGPWGPSHRREAPEGEAGGRRPGS